MFEMVELCRCNGSKTGYSERPSESHVDAGIGGAVCLAKRRWWIVVERVANRRRERAGGRALWPVDTQRSFRQEQVDVGSRMKKAN